jgi:hypothetical protein
VALPPRQESKNLPLGDKNGVLLFGKCKIRNFLTEGKRKFWKAGDPVAHCAIFVDY